ncbi:MAG TPA: hypothetical protein VF575_02370 [Candidatus Saccharimonadales bacterium]|jgi:hypothetical protein
MISNYSETGAVLYSFSDDKLDKVHELIDCDDALQLSLTPGEAITYRVDTVTSLALGELFKSTDETFDATVKYVGARAVKSTMQRVFAIQKSGQTDTIEAALGIVHMEGLVEGSDSDFPPQLTPVFEVLVPKKSE